jgi:hypothetical protein
VRPRLYTGWLPPAGESQADGDASDPPAKRARLAAADAADEEAVVAAYNAARRTLAVAAEASEPVPLSPRAPNCPRPCQRWVPIGRRSESRVRAHCRFRKKLPIVLVDLV